MLTHTKSCRWKFSRRRIKVSHIFCFIPVFIPFSNIMQHCIVITLILVLSGYSKTVIRITLFAFPSFRTLCCYYRSTNSKAHYWIICESFAIIHKAFCYFWSNTEIFESFYFTRGIASYDLSRSNLIFKFGFVTISTPIFFIIILFSSN